VVLVAKLLAVAFATGTLWLTYLVTAEMADRRAALYAVLILAGTRFFFSYSHQVLTCMPSACLAVLSLYFYLRRRPMWTGVFAALAFMTRFPQGMLLVSYSLLFLVDFLRGRDRRPALRGYVIFLAAYAVPVIGFLVFNYFRYHGEMGWQGAIWPFVFGERVIAEASLWRYQGTWLYYFDYLQRHHILYWIIPAGLWLFWRDRSFRLRQHGLPALTIALFLVYFTRMPHKELRFALVFLPFLALFAGMSLRRLFSPLRQPAVHVLLVLALLGYGLANVKMHRRVDPSGKEAGAYINSTGYAGDVITSSPHILPYVNNRVTPSFVPDRFLDLIEANKHDLVVYTPKEFVYATEDAKAALTAGRLEACLAGRYDRVFDSADAKYPIQVYKIKPDRSLAP
jgi:4-amino-4-deoxy-L-arabinose transferase-like glycosyltransferase